MVHGCNVWPVGWGGPHMGRMPGIGVGGGSGMSIGAGWVEIYVQEAHLNHKRIGGLDGRCARCRLGSS
jgi:hypothetical protein